MLLNVTDPVGPKNLDTIKQAALDADLIVVAHGNLPPTLQHHACAMFDVLRGSGKRLNVLGLSGQAFRCILSAEARTSHEKM
jgi:hypothetical protein